jgi:hypothetical protein
MELYLSMDGLRAALVLILAVGQAITAFWPAFRKWPETIPSRSARLQNPVMPIEWAFAVWGPIFLGIIAFAIWQAMPANLADPLARRIGWLAIAAFAANILWEAWVPKRDLDWASVAIIWAELALLLVILLLIADADPQGAQFWLVFAPFQLFTGWVSAAVFVNTASTLQRSGVTVGTALSTVMLSLAGLLGGAVAAATGGWIYAAAVAWALFGIVVANVARVPDRLVAAVAGGLALFVLSAPALS